MKKNVIIVIASVILAAAVTGCGESEESKRNLGIIAREAERQRTERERAETKRRRQIEDAKKWHLIQMEAYEKSMTPKKK